MAKKRTVRHNPTVERVRAAREALAGDCEYDLEKLGRVLMERQARSKRRYVAPKRRPISG